MHQVNNGYPQRQNYAPATPPPRASSRMSKLAVLFVFILLGVGMFLYMRSTNKEIETVQQVVQSKDQQISQINSERDVLTAKYDELGSQTCKGTWSVETGCVLPETIVLAPQGGESFCFGSSTTVTWDKNFLSEGTVDILLTNEGTPHLLGTVSASEGKYDWDITKSFKTKTATGTPTTANLVPGDLYSINLQAQVQIPGGETDMFSIKDCSAPAL
jgi:hypothetical protein